MRIFKKFPDPFLKKDGTRVATVEEWESQREYIKDMMLNIQYGTMPGPPEEVKVTVKTKKEYDFGETLEDLHLEFIPKASKPDISFGMDVIIWHPSKECVEERQKKIPEFGKNGLPTFLHVGGGMMFDMLEDGYMVMCFQNDQLEPMEMGNPIVGPAQEAYEKLEPGKYTWGSIAVWAWGAMRLLDYALTREEVNKDQIIISGHSRNGKTALLAGALDERFAIVDPAGSGCAGAGSYIALGEGSEDLASLTDRRRWWAWTHKDFEKYAYEERGESKEKLPFDQHFLMGLVAPRPLLRVEGLADDWANPEGTSCSFLATEPIYEFLGVPERNGIHYREGGHEHNDADKEALRRFAEWHLFGVEPDRSFKKTIIDEKVISTLFDWKNPN